MRKNSMLALVGSLLLGAGSSRAITILSGPSFIQSTNAPLAGSLQLTSDVDSRVSITVADGMGVWARNFYDFGKTHAIPLLGFKPNRTNLITVTVYDKSRTKATAAQPLQFVTGSLPGDFPNLHLLQSNPQKMEPGYRLFRTQPGVGYYTM